MVILGRREAPPTGKASDVMDITLGQNQKGLNSRTQAFSGSRDTSPAICARCLPDQADVDTRDAAPVRMDKRSDSRYRRRVGEHVNAWPNAARVAGSPAR